jgi:uncharacterized protein (DUF2267 family)
MTAGTRLDVLDRSVEKAYVWINDVATELQTDDRHEAYRALRAFLHVLRDRLPIAESAQLAAQLPLLIRGIFYEGWQPARVPQRYRDPLEFLDRVAQEAKLHGPTEASFAVTAAAKTLTRHISPGEIDDILRTLPAPIRALITG